MSLLLANERITTPVTGVVPGEWPGTGGGFGPCFDMASPPVDGTVLADVETGAFGLVVTL